MAAVNGCSSAIKSPTSASSLGAAEVEERIAVPAEPQVAGALRHLLPARPRAASQLVEDLGTVEPGAGAQLPFLLVRDIVEEAGDRRLMRLHESAETVQAREEGTERGRKDRRALHRPFHELGMTANAGGEPSDVGQMALGVDTAVIRNRNNADQGRDGSDANAARADARARCRGGAGGARRCARRRRKDKSPRRFAGQANRRRAASSGSTSVIGARPLPYASIFSFVR